MRRDALRADLLRARDRKAAERKVDVEYAQRVIARAKVDAKFLTDSHEWNAYLEQIEARNALDAQELEGLQAQLESPAFRTAEQSQKLLFDCQLLIARIQARDECIAIPKRIQGSADSSA